MGKTMIIAGDISSFKQNPHKTAIPISTDRLVLLLDPRKYNPTTGIWGNAEIPVDRDFLATNINSQTTKPTYTTSSGAMNSKPAIAFSVSPSTSQTFVGSLNLIVNKFTLWFTFANGTTNPLTALRRLFNFTSTAGDGVSFSFDTSGSGSAMRLVTPGSVVTNLVAPAQTGVRTHVAIVYDVNTFRVYINGVLDTTVSGQTIEKLVGTLYIGSSSSGSGSANATLGNTYLKADAQSAAQVLAEYNRLNAYYLS